MNTVYLDLEMTVLDDFTKGFDARPVNTAKVKKYLQSIEATSVRLFSYAICNKDDIADFVYYHQRWLEGILGVKIDLTDCFTTAELFELCESNHLHFDSVADCSRYHGKQYGFEQYLRLKGHHVGQSVLLVDDLVSAGLVFIPELDLSINFVDVATLPS